MTKAEFAKQVRGLCAEGADLARRVVECDLSTPSDHDVAHAVSARAQAIEKHLGLLAEPDAAWLARVADRARDAAQAMQALVLEVGRGK